MQSGRISKPSVVRFAAILITTTTASSPALADETADSRGWGVRGGVAAAAFYARLSYQGPSADSGNEPGMEPAPEGDLDLSTSAFILGGEASFGVGHSDGRGNRYGFDVAALVGPVLAGGHDIPHTDIAVAALASIGPSYTRSISPKMALDAAIRASLFAVAGSQDDIGAYDNVFEFPAYVGLLGRLGGTYRLGDPGHTALTVGLQGGPQFAGSQSALLLGLSLGVQFD